MRSITVRQEGINTTFYGVEGMNVQVETSLDKHAKVTLDFDCELTANNVENIREMMSYNRVPLSHTSKEASWDSRYPTYADDVYDETDNYNDENYTCTSKEISW